MNKINLINLFFIAYLSCFFISCKKNIHLDASYEEDYHKNYNYFNFTNDLVAHFPHKDQLFENSSFVIDTSGYYNTEEFNLTVRNCKSLINNIKKRYANKKIYSINDSCLIAVNDFLIKSKLIFSDEIKDKKSKVPLHCNADFAIIPNFWDENLNYRDDSTICKLKKDFKYIIIESKKGIFSDKIDLGFSSMPDEIKHGYSRGLSFSDTQDVLIYWLIIW